MAALLAGCGGGNSPITSQTPHSAEPVTYHSVVFIGDSITARWDIPVAGAINAGIGGQRSCEMATRFATDVLARNASEVVILGGINDISLEADPNPACIYDMVQRAQGAGMHVMVGTLLPDEHWAGSKAIHSDAEGIAAVKRWNDEIRAAAGGFGFTLVDYEPALRNPDGSQNQSLFVDGVHPNADGYQLMWGVLQPLLNHTR